jgi:hypothetical protein
MRDFKNALENEVDFIKLASLLSKRLGYKIELQLEFYDKGRKARINSNELKSHTGILSSSLESFRIVDFGNAITTDNSQFCIHIHFTMKYNSGGSNGHEIDTYWWDFEKGIWISRTDLLNKK